MQICASAKHIVHIPGVAGIEILQTYNITFCQISHIAEPPEGRCRTGFGKRDIKLNLRDSCMSGIPIRISITIIYMVDSTFLH